MRGPRRVHRTEDRKGCETGRIVVEELAGLSVLGRKSGRRLGLAPRVLLKKEGVPLLSQTQSQTLFDLVYRCHKLHGYDSFH